MSKKCHHKIIYCSCHILDKITVGSNRHIDLNNIASCNLCKLLLLKRPIKRRVLFWSNVLVKTLHVMSIFSLVLTGVPISFEAQIGLYRFCEICESLINDISSDLDSECFWYFS
jgi:hypothetical protein